MAVTSAQIVNFLVANPGMTDAQIVAAMDQYGISPSQMASAVGLKEAEVVSRIVPVLAQDVAQNGLYTQTIANNETGQTEITQRTLPLGFNAYQDESGQLSYSRVDSAKPDKIQLYGSQGEYRGEEKITTSTQDLIRNLGPIALAAGGSALVQSLLGGAAATGAATVGTTGLTAAELAALDLSLSGAGGTAGATSLGGALTTGAEVGTLTNLTGGSGLLTGEAGGITAQSVADKLAADAAAQAKITADAAAAKAATDAATKAAADAAAKKAATEAAAKATADAAAAKTAADAAAAKAAADAATAKAAADAAAAKAAADAAAAKAAADAAIGGDAAAKAAAAKAAADAAASKATADAAAAAAAAQAKITADAAAAAAAAAAAKVAATTLTGGLTAAQIAALLGSTATTAGGLLQQQTSAAAALAAQQKIDAETAAAKASAQFRPVGMTTRFGTSQFQVDPITGRLTSAGYTLSPEAKNAQDRLVKLAESGLVQAEGAQAKFAPLQTGAQSLFGLGQGYLNAQTDPRLAQIASQYLGQSAESKRLTALGADYLTQSPESKMLTALGSRYIAQSPEEVAQNYLNQQMALLQPGRELELANLQNRLQQQGRGGLSVAQGGTLGATTPELQALFNARATQEAQLAAQAQQAGQQQVQFGAGLVGTGQQLGIQGQQFGSNLIGAGQQLGIQGQQFGMDTLAKQQALEQQRVGFGSGLLSQGAGLQGQYYAGQQAAYAPYNAAMSQVVNLEQLAQQPYTMGIDLGKIGATTGFDAGRLGLQGAGQSVALATGPAATNNPYASLLSGAGSSTVLTEAAAKALIGLFS
jgi:hypothetical protein